MERSLRTRRLLAFGSLTLATLVGFAVGCGKGGGDSSGVVDRARIDRCGGFTAAKAAQVLGVSADEIEVSGSQQYEGLRICSFMVRDGIRGVSFSLAWSETVEETAADIAQERDMIGVARGVIDSATGTSSEGAPSYEIPGIGDEAFYADVNGTVVARVGNVRVQVMNAPDLESKKTVASMVVAGLR